MAGPDEIRNGEAPKEPRTEQEIRTRLAALQVEREKIVNENRTYTPAGRTTLEQITREENVLSRRLLRLGTPNATDVDPDATQTPAEEPPSSLPEAEDSPLDNEHARLREAAGFLHGGLYYFAQEVLNMELDDSLVSALFTGSNDLSEVMRTIGMADEEIQGVSRAAAAYVAASRELENNTTSTDWVASVGNDIIDRCMRHASTLSDFTQHYRRPASPPASAEAPASLPISRADPQRQAGKATNFRDLFGEKGPGADQPPPPSDDEFDYLNVTAGSGGAAPAPGASPEPQTTPTIPRRRRIRDALKQGARHLGSMRERLADTGDRLAEGYRQEFVRRAQPEGERLMAAQSARGRALGAAEGNPQSGWTRADTVRYVIGLGGIKLQSDAWKALKGVFGKKMFASLRDLRGKQFLEIPKEYMDAYKRGNKIIEAFIRPLERLEKGKRRMSEAETQALHAAVENGSISDADARDYVAMRAGWFAGIGFTKRRRELNGLVRPILEPVWNQEVGRFREKAREQVVGVVRNPRALRDKIRPKRPDALIVPELNDMNRKLILMAVAKGELSKIDSDTFFVMWQREENKGEPVSDVEKAAVRAVISVVT